MAKTTPTAEQQAVHQPAGAVSSALTRRPSSLEDTRVIYYHCDWHASHYVKVMLDQTFGEPKS